MGLFNNYKITHFIPYEPEFGDLVEVIYADGGAKGCIGCYGYVVNENNTNGINNGLHIKIGTGVWGIGQNGIVKLLKVRDNK